VPLLERSRLLHPNAIDLLYPAGYNIHVIEIRQTDTYKKMRRSVKDKTTLWDPIESLETEEDMAAYFNAALADNDPALIAAVLGDIARAKGMSLIAKQTGLGRESLYKALSPEGNPEFSTILKVINALGLQLHVKSL
jgi:probable addiction module antidote protein